MENNVLSWGKALRAGFQPREYPYRSEAVPEGECVAILDFKIWAKKTIGISCYFTEIDTNRKFQVTVYIDKKYRHYYLRDVPINFATCPTKEIYKIKIGRDKAGRTKFLAAELLTK